MACAAWGEAMDRIMTIPAIIRPALRGLLAAGWITLYAALLFGCGGGVQEGAIDVDGFRKALTANQATIVLDVRTPEELTGELGKLDGVVNIPVQELSSRLDELNAHKDQSIYVICRSGNRSRKASDLLRSHGFRAINVDGGMRAWREAFGDRNR
jgi:rhodanese-related sulfurtransferase